MTATVQRIMKVRVGDAKVLGDCYEQFGHFEAQISWPPSPGGVTYIEAPYGFYWRVEPSGKLKVFPGWWRKLLHTATGKWSIP